MKLFSLSYTVAAAATTATDSAITTTTATVVVVVVLNKINLLCHPSPMWMVMTIMR